MIILLLVLACLVLPWINRSRIKGLQKELARLQRDMAELRIRSGKPVDTGEAQFQEAEVETEPEWGRDLTERAPVPSVEPITPAAEAAAYAGDDADHGRAPSSPRDDEPAPGQESAEKRSEGFELQFGGRAFVWLGAVALAFAGFYLVKYSIEAGLLSPTVRVVLGLIFGIGLLYAGNWVRTQPGFANGARIAQALSGAGIAVLYAGVYSATSLYNLVPSFVGFAGLAVVTAAAVALSVWHGRPIALLGLVGGFLTPALVQSPHPQASILFAYLLLVLAGLMVVIRYRSWWTMGIPAVLGAYSWVPIWLYGGNFKPGDTLWLGLFLIAASATVVISSKEHYEKDADGSTSLPGITSAFNYLALCGAIFLMGLTADRGGYGAIGWCLFGLLSAGGIFLAHSNEKLYGLAPWMSVAVNALMLVQWQYRTAQEFALVIGIFAVLHIAGAYFLQLRSRDPLAWAGLTGVAGLGYYLLGYFKIHLNPLYADIPLFWGILALVLAAIGTYASLDVMRRIPGDYPRKQHVLAVYAGVVAAFISIALTIELKREFLSVAVAAEVLAVAWINTRAGIRSLRWIGALLACFFGFLLIPQLLLIIQLTVYSLVEAELYLQKSIPIVNWPLFQLGLPALCFMAASYLLRGEKDDRLVFSLEASAIALLGTMGYYLTRHIFHLDQNVLFVKAGFVERGVITNIFFVYGLTCLWAGKRFERGAVWLGGLVLSGIALFRIGYFDLFLYNPLWSGQKVGGLPVVNGLLITYGLPLAWIWTAVRRFPRIGKVEWNKYGYGVTLLLAFVFISLEVRQLFHGTLLNGIANSAEIYTYSAVWLFFGIGLLFFGTLRRDKMIRVASLPIILLTIAKVFLYDASALTGLWRVFSFFCLGLCLLCISWFYSRFVFDTNRR